MKNKLIRLLTEENKHLKGLLINKPVEEYVDKIYENTSIIMHFEKGILAGFIAYYCNNIETKVAFLTMLCISEKFSGHGLGKLLLNASLENLKNKNFKKLELEVSNKNIKASTFYKKYGFKDSIINKETTIMKFEIQ